MPCSISENAKLPEYIKRILKEIEAGNDDTLKSCVCNLKQVTDPDEGCPITYTDDKGNTDLTALFPFCIEDTETDPKTITWEPGLPEYKYYQVGFALKDLMELYWNFKGWGNIVGSSSGGCPKTSSSICSQNIATPVPPKNRVCLDITYANHIAKRSNTYLEDYNNVPPCSLYGFAFAGITDSTKVDCYRYNELYYPVIVAGAFGAENEGSLAPPAVGQVQVATLNFKVSSSPSATTYFLPLYDQAPATPGCRSNITIEATAIQSFV